MIILNRRKDYFDYLAGVYSVDTKKVLNRLNDITSDELHFTEPLLNGRRWYSEQHNTYVIYVANRKYILEQVEDGIWQFHMMHKTNTNLRGDVLHMLSSEVDNKGSWTYYTESVINREFIPQRC